MNHQCFGFIDDPSVDIDIEIVSHNANNWSCSIVKDVSDEKSNSMPIEISEVLNLLRLNSIVDESNVDISLNESASIYEDNTIKNTPDNRETMKQNMKLKNSKCKNALQNFENLDSTPISQNRRIKSTPRSITKRKSVLVVSNIEKEPEVITPKRNGRKRKLDDITDECWNEKIKLINQEEENIERHELVIE